MCENCIYFEFCAIAELRNFESCECKTTEGESSETEIETEKQKQNA